MNRLAIVTTTLLSALAISSAALADEYTPSEDAERRGIMIGIGLNGGHIAFNSEDGGNESLNESYGAELHIAYMLGKKLAISFDGWAMQHQTETLVSDATITHVIATVGPQYWVLPRMWIRAGFGYARYHRVDDVAIIGEVEGESENVPGLALGLGLEVISGKNFAIDIQMRGATGFYENANASNLGLGVGFTWF